MGGLDGALAMTRSGRFAVKNTPKILWRSPQALREIPTTTMLL